MNATARDARSKTNAGNARAGNAAARQVAGCTGKGNCPVCKRIGLPVLLLRYAMLPGFLDTWHGTGFQGPLGDKVLDKQLKYHQYTLRTLRQGFVHVYLGSPGHWHVYAVTPNGYLRLLPDPDDVDAKTERELSERCERQGDGIPASFIHIPPRVVQRGGKVWIAFSSTSWTKNVRTHYEKNPDGRMQSFDVKKLASSPGAQPHTFAADTPLLHDHVDEYATDADELRRRRLYSTRDAFSGKSVAAKVWDGAEPLLPARVGKAQATGDYIKNYEATQAKAGNPQRVSTVALFDAVGMVNEANASRLTFVQWRQEYCDALQRPATISRSIQGLKKFVEQNALQSRTAMELREGQPDVQKTEDQIIEHGMRIPGTTTTRAQRAAEDATGQWNRLAGNYDESKRGQFQNQFDQGLKSIWKEIELADADWAAWAKDPQWKTWFDDFDPKSEEQQALFVQTFAACLAGGIVEATPAEEAAGSGDATATTEGFKLWKLWLTSAANAPDNPAFRVLLGNRSSLLDDLLPQGGDVKKGDKIYDTVKSLVGSDEFKKYLQKPLKDAAGHAQLAMSSALNRLGDEVDKAAQQAALRAQAAAYKLYQDMDVLIFNASITVQEYVDLLASEAFKRAQAGIQRGLQVTSREGGRVVRSILDGGMNALRIASPEARNAVISVTFCLIVEGSILQQNLQRQGEALKQWLREQAGLQEAQRQIGKAAREVASAAGKLGRTIKLNAITLSREAGAAMSELSRGVQLEVREAALLIGRLTNSGRFALTHGGELGWSAGSAFFQGWVLTQSIRDYRQAYGEKLPDAEIALVSAVTGTTAATVEALGQGVKLYALAKAGTEEAAALTKAGMLGGRMVVIGSTISAAAAMFDAVTEFRASARSSGKGDIKATYLHFAAGAAFFVAAVSGTAAAIMGTSALLGPFGLAVGLVAVGVLLAMAAISAERTVAEIWLDRCYFGKHERSEGAWADAQFDEELAGLNAIVLGLEASLGFNDDWLGISEQFTHYDTVKLSIRMPGADAATACKAVLTLHHVTEGDIPVLTLRTANLASELAPDPAATYGKRFYKWFRNAQIDNTSHQGVATLEGEVQVRVEEFQKAKLHVDYWPNHDVDPSAKASFDIDNED